MKLWEYFFVQIENKNNNFIQLFILFRSVSVFDAFHDSITTQFHCCLWRIRKLSDFIKNILIVFEDEQRS